MFLKKLFKSKTEKVKIIRVANEGFNVESYKKGPTSIFLNAVVYDLQGDITITKEQNFRYENDLMEGCFCFLEGFDQNQLKKDGNLFFRENQTWNIGYLPKDELVFARNTKNNDWLNPNDRFVVGYYSDELDIFTEKPFLNKYRGTVYEFVKMPLELAVERLKNHVKTKEDGRADEMISEIYLTKKQIEEKLKISK